MSDTNLSAMLRNLSREYYQNRISFEDYRAQRKILLDKIDEEFNGQHAAETQADNSATSSIFTRVIKFFKNTGAE